ncbi:Uncharacterised protein [Klebsiella pneumoniae]|uniref:Uncharacterized protein n=1 Tax=Klebsiella pneumoniae TaxID=573 RepID=A0A378C4G5_KLEPN|nr:Uncharacterised protein [Klebsiella pneumoniae]
MPSDSDFNFIEDNIDQQVLLFYQLISGAKKKAVNQYCSFFSFIMGKYAREKQDIKMLNEMNNTSWVWPDNINW